MTDTVDHVPCIVEGKHMEATRHTAAECLALRPDSWELDNPREGN